MAGAVELELLDTATQPGSPGWADFVATSALIDDVYAELEGDRGMTRTPEQRRSHDSVARSRLRLPPPTAARGTPRVVNDALGYRPSVVSGGWRLDL